MENSSLFVTSTAAPVRNQVLRNIRQAILSRHFRPGQRLIERELCELTGVSRTPVREALRQLESEGLVEMVPNRGPVVAEITLDDVAEIYEVRGALEALAARRFAERATDDEVVELERRLAAFEEAVAQERLTDLVDRKDEFYAVLLKGARNRRVRQMLDSLHSRIVFMRAASLARNGRSAMTVQEIRRIVEAIKDRNPDAAAALSLTHVENAAEAALASLRQDLAADEQPVH